MLKRSIIILALALIPNLSLAGEPCQSDADCLEGEECISAPCACASEESCDVCEAASECLPKASEPEGECEADADCGLGMVCVELEFSCSNDVVCEECLCEPCPDDQPDCGCDCPECPEPEPCDPILVKACQIEERSCAADSDCLDGFICEEVQSCTSSDCVCAACACAECPEGEECEPCDCPEEPVCECEPEEPVCEVTGSLCAPAMEACVSDEDCLEGFECVDMGASLDCACECECAAPACEGDVCAAPECECPPCDCEEESGQMACLPLGWKAAGGGDDVSEESENGDPVVTEGDVLEQSGDLLAEGDAAAGDSAAPGSDSSSEVVDQGAAKKSSGCTISPIPVSMRGHLILVGILSLGLAAARRRSRLGSRKAL